ncbi:hypothetical protein, partial [uncultured Duncaniella sp.]
NKPSTSPQQAPKKFQPLLALSDLLGLLALLDLLDLSPLLALLALFDLLGLLGLLVLLGLLDLSPLLAYNKKTSAPPLNSKLTTQKLPSPQQLKTQTSKLYTFFNRFIAVFFVLL